MRYIVLNEEEVKQVRRIYDQSQSWTTRWRCLFLLLSARGFSMTQIAGRTGACWHTVYRFFNKWQSASGYRLGLLNTSPGRGRKQKLQEFPMASIIEKLLDVHGYSPNVLCAILEKEYGITVCKKTLRSFIIYYNL